MESRGPLALGAIVALLLSGCIVGPATRDDTQVRVALGAILGSGLGAAGLREAAELAVQQINAATPRLRLELLTEADNADAGRALDALVARGAVAVLDLRGPVDATALAQRAAAAKVPLLLPAPASLSAASATYAYLLSPAVAAEAAALDALVDREDVERAHVVSVNDAYGAGVSSALATRLGATLGSSATVASGDTAAAIRAGRDACATGADGVVVIAYAETSLALLEGLRAGGCRDRVSVLQGEAAYYVGSIPAATEPGLTSGVRGVLPATAQPALFRAVFDVMYQNVPGPFSEQAYDAVYYVALAALTSKGAPPGQEGASRDAVKAEDIHSRLSAVASVPGTKTTRLDTAVEHASNAEEIDWSGVAHDLDLTAGQAPAGSYVRYRVEADGRPTVEPGIVLT